MMEKLQRSLIKHEGKKEFPYVDTVGKITIGIGYNLTDRGLPEEWINTQFLEDVNYFYYQLTTTFSWFNDLNVDRQIVLIDMAFMGWKRFLTFEKMLQALAAEDYQKAADEMLNSEWAEQVKGRARDLANGMATGVYNI